MSWFFESLGGKILFGIICAVGGSALVYGAKRLIIVLGRYLEEDEEETEAEPAKKVTANKSQTPAKKKPAANKKPAPKKKPAEAVATA